MTFSIGSIPARYWQLGKLAFAVVLIVLIWRAADGRQILQTLRGAHIGVFGVAVLLLLIQTILSACRWKFTAKTLGQSFSMRHAIREYFISQAVNQALPGGMLGDAARAVRARSDVGMGVSGLAVALERLAGQIAMFVVFACAFFATYTQPGGIEWPAHVGNSIAWTITLVVLFATGCTVLRNRVHLLGAAVSHWLGLAAGALFSRDVAPAQLAFGGVITLCNLSAFGVCAWAIGMPIPIAGIFAIVPLILFSMLIPLTISGWGLREGSAALLLPLVGFSTSEAIATSILFGIAILFSIIPGLFLTVPK